MAFPKSSERRFSTRVVSTCGHHVAIAGIRMRRILSDVLFSELTGASTAQDFKASCHDRWVDFADGLVAVPEPIEGFMIVGRAPNPGFARPEVVVGVAAVGRGTEPAASVDVALRSAATLSTLLSTTFDYAELEPISCESEMDLFEQFVHAPRVMEFRRRLERVRVSVGAVDSPGLGFAPAEPGDDPGGHDLGLEHLFQWVPSDDSWRRLLDAMEECGTLAGLVVHFRGFSRAPRTALDSAWRTMSEAEKLLGSGMPVHGQIQADAIFSLKVDALRHAALERVAVLEGPAVAARVFLVSAAAPSAALIATVESSIDDASVPDAGQAKSVPFRGGARIASCEPSRMFEHLDAPAPGEVFGLREASAILRTPMPSGIEYPGLPVIRWRTAAFVGRSGKDTVLGDNDHRGLSVPVSLAGPDRFRHVYIIGQTGTGKSTLLARMIHDDLVKGRGVVVLDPHGSLIEEVLERFPMKRARDLVLLDVADAEMPVGFNVLRIDTTDLLEYRRARDLIIDDLHSYMIRTYAADTMGPVFETHFRSMLGILLGTRPQKAPRIPNLMVFRSLYLSDKVRRELVEQVAEDDLVLGQFIAETDNIKSRDNDLSAIAPYITSKFNRFLSDLSLRNITCQNSMLDMDDIVNTGKVLLVHLAKGRVGDQASGLLASQVVSRIRLAVMRRGPARGARPCYLYADEFHLFADDRFTELLAEGRKFGLALTVAHQYVNQIPEAVLRAVLGNVGTTIALRTGPKDAEFLDSFFRPSFKDRDLMSLPNFSAYVRSSGALGEIPFSMRLRPLTSRRDTKRAHTLREMSRTRYGRDRAEVEAEIRHTMKSYTSGAPNEDP